jgi:N-hydroxyarylamine O-acetyltransferase
MMDITMYLNRIGYRGPLDPNIETLRALHLAHMLAVPFENLDIGLGRPIVLDQAALFDKIVVRRRGGFCYELNGLFAALLRELGFEVTMLSAGVAHAGGGFGPEFDHLTLLVTTDHRPLTTDRPLSEQRTKNKEQSDDQPLTTGNTQSAMVRLADVGFGDSFREPLRFDAPGEQPQGRNAYRIDREGQHLTLLQREPGQGQNEDGVWEPQYRFTLQPRRHAEFAGMCQYHQSSPQSSFTQRRVCTRATPEGRITLNDMRLIVTTTGERQERLLADEQEYRSVLRDRFGIDLTENRRAEDRG